MAAINKISWTKWFELKKTIFLQSWSLEVQAEGASRFGFCVTSSRPVDGDLLSVASHCLSSLCEQRENSWVSSSSYKITSPLG